MSFIVGDCVEHVSGTGTKMAVTLIIGSTNALAKKAYEMSGYTDEDAVCEWFDKNNVRQSGSFKLATLKKCS